MINESNSKPSFSPKYLTADAMTRTRMLIKVIIKAINMIQRLLAHEPIAMRHCITRCLFI